MAFTNFCCRSGGSNLNAGTLTGDTTEPGTAASFTYASGSWVQSTGVFTVASGDPSTDGVAVGDFASVYPDAATVTPFVGRITARDATTITVSLSAKSGTAPANGTLDTTIKVGGAWAGPSGSEAFPIDFVNTQSCVNTSGDLGRVNMKNDQTYSITARMAILSNWFRIQGYTTSYGDFGRATIDGGTTGASYILLDKSSSQLNPIAVDLIFKDNGATGNASGTEDCHYIRCVVRGMRGNGLLATFGAVECEAYNCNLSNTTNKGGFAVGTLALRCISHGHTGSNSSGFLTSGNTSLIDCIAYDNGGIGFRLNNANVLHSAIRCDAYNNTGDGFQLWGNSYGLFYLESCNAVSNGGYGVSRLGSRHFGEAVNCGFGAGTAANTSGQTGDLDAVAIIGSVTYADDVTPWNDPANGDFTIALAAAKGAGRGTFTQTEAGESGTVGTIDIGAAQAAAGGGGLFRTGMHGGIMG